MAGFSLDQKTGQIGQSTSNAIDNSVKRSVTTGGIHINEATQPTGLQVSTPVVVAGVVALAVVAYLVMKGGRHA